jgi:hypothetical protein
VANKPRMGSDPFQKKDPLGWIGGEQTEKPSESTGKAIPTSNPGKPSKGGKSSPPGPSGKTSNPSKHDLPSPPSFPDNPSGHSGPTRGTTTSKGLRPGWTRATFIVKEETVQQLKAVAYWDRKELKRVVEEAFSTYLDGKRVKSIPLEAREGRGGENNLKGQSAANRGR